MLLRTLLLSSLLTIICSKRIRGESCNYGVTSVRSIRVPSGEDYCQNVYLPHYIFGHQMELSYKFTCSYIGSSPQGVVSIYANNGCSGIPSNETILENGDFYCCEDCDDECDWLYLNVSWYKDRNCAILDHYAYDLGILDWVDSGCVNLNDSTMYMELNDTLFTNAESDDENDCENREWYYKFYSPINECESVGPISNRHTFYYSASISIGDGHSGHASYAIAAFNCKHNKIITTFWFVLSYTYFMW